MNFLPKAAGTRPRVACEIMPQGVVAGRAEQATGPLEAVARSLLETGAIAPSLRPGNIADRVAVAAAIRRVLEEVGARSNARDGDITLIIPDSAVRVLLLEFDALPNRLSEALPLVRFRLKKLLPFDADEAMVSFQVMSTGHSMVRVLAVAIPRDVLSEYETAAREAGFEPGAVIPSTLAALAGVDDQAPALLVNANDLGVTTAIIRGGILLLHRSVDLQASAAGTPAAMPPALFDPGLTAPTVDLMPGALAVGPAEWEALPTPSRAEPAPAFAVDNLEPLLPSAAPMVGSPFTAHATNAGGAAPLAVEIAQAVSVAAAYFEDTLAAMPDRVLSAGPLGAEQLSAILTQQGVVEADGLRVRELVELSALAASAGSTVPMAWLSGISGALRG